MGHGAVEAGQKKDKRRGSSEEAQRRRREKRQMELAKIRNLSDEELTQQVKTTAEQLFRLRFQVSLGQNDGVKKLRELRKEIAQIKTVAKERQLGIRGATPDTGAAKTVAAEKAPSKTGAKATKKKGAR